jgi:hypothetical protein
MVHDNSTAVVALNIISAQLLTGQGQVGKERHMFKVMMLMVVINLISIRRLG